MRTEKMLLLSVLLCVAALPVIGSAWDRYDIDEGRLNVSGDGYALGISNAGDDMMLLRIMDTGNVSDPEVQHRIFLEANWLATELGAEDFLAFYGNNEELFQQRLERKLNDLVALEEFGKENGECAPNLVRFFIEEA